MARKKKNPAARYAFIGLIVAGLAAISAALIGVAKGMIGLQMFKFENTDALNVALQISIGLIVLGLAAYAVMTPDTVRQFITGRQARYGSNALILTLAFLGILIVANVLAFQNPGFLGAPWDLTEDKSNTLAPETQQALATLPGKVHATAFYTTIDQFGHTALDKTGAEELLNKFKANSHGNFDFEFSNPDTDPVTAQAAGITGDGKILLQMGKTKEIAASASETELTKALIRLISPQARAVYFLQGHGEPALDSSGDTGFSVAKRTLESKNYTVGTLDLVSGDKIPQDALAIIVAGPKKPITTDEVRLLKDYVNKGGALVVMEDPTFFTQLGDSTDPLAGYLTSDWGIKLDNDIVIDLVNTQNPFQAVSSRYNQHAITQGLTEKYIVVLPQARSVSITGDKENVTQTAIISTTDRSWGETQMDAAGTPAFDPAVDIPGPLNLEVAGENSKTSGRVAVFGNSVFAADANFDIYGNGNIFINSVDWAAEQEDLLNITPRTPTPRTMKLIGNLQFIIMIILAIFVLPGAIVFMGISSWVARRRRG